MWSHILRDQLDATADEFWDCVNKGAPPDRGAPHRSPEAIPTEVVYQLLHRVGLSETAIAAMSRAEALDRIRRFWETGE